MKDNEMVVDRKLFNDLLEDRARLLKALQGVVHHNRGTKLGFQLPESLMRQVREAIQASGPC